MNKRFQKAKCRYGNSNIKSKSLKHYEWQCQCRCKEDIQKHNFNECMKEIKTKLKHQ